MRLKNTLRHRLFARIMESPLADKKQLHTGEMLNRMEEDTRIVTDVLCTALPSVIGIVVQLVAAFCFLAVLNLSLAWILVGIMPVANTFHRRAHTIVCARGAATPYAYPLSGAHTTYHYCS